MRVRGIGGSETGIEKPNAKIMLLCNMNRLTKPLSPRLLNPFG